MLLIIHVCVLSVFGYLVATLVALNQPIKLLIISGSPKLQQAFLLDDHEVDKRTGILMTILEKFWVVDVHV